MEMMSLIDHLHEILNFLCHSPFINNLSHYLMGHPPLLSNGRSILARGVPLAGGPQPSRAKMLRPIDKSGGYPIK